MNKDKRIAIFTCLREQNPEPRTELNYSSAFELLVAVTLSAQATDVSVNKATLKLFPVANTPEAIYALGVEGLKGYIKTMKDTHDKRILRLRITQQGQYFLDTKAGTYLNRIIKLFGALSTENVMSYYKTTWALVEATTRLYEEAKKDKNLLPT